MDKIKFSIIIPTYNRPMILKSCLEALFKQISNYDIFEVIIVDDGSKDKLIDKYPELFKNFNIKYFFITHKGPAAARNFGLQHASGDVIIFLDDDSIVLDNWANSVIKNWENFQDIDGIGGYVFSNFKDPLCAQTNAEIFNWYFEESFFKKNNFISTCNASYKKKILEKIDGFDESFKGAFAEDRDLNIRLTSIGAKFKLSKDIQVYHGINLSFFDFLYKHFNYGRGAYIIFKKYGAISNLSFTSYIKLYKSILVKYKNIKELILIFTLLTISQIMTIFGYFYALIFKK